jgi:hypothetical protein
MLEREGKVKIVKDVPAKTRLMEAIKKVKRGSSYQKEFKDIAFAHLYVSFWLLKNFFSNNYKGI